MRPFLAESMVIVVASITLVLGTLALGGAMLRETASSPPLPLAMMPGCVTAPVVQVDSSGIAGQAQLCVTDEAVRPGLRVDNLTPDTAYLALFEYFERPAICQGFPCGHADLRVDGSGGTLARMDATVASGTRRAELWGDFRDLPLTQAAQVTLTLFDRGSVRDSDRQRRAHQLLSLPIVPADGRVGGGDRVAGRAVAQAIFLPSTEGQP